MKKTAPRKCGFCLLWSFRADSNRRPSDYEYETVCLMSLTGNLYKILKTAFELFRAGFVVKFVDCFVNQLFVVFVKFAVFGK